MLLFAKSLQKLFKILLIWLLYCLGFNNGYYRLSINTGNPISLCPLNASTCSDGSLSYLCKPSPKPAQTCIDFQNVKMVNRLKFSFLMGHNGIRKKVADDFQIANMNLLHWSNDLELMAHYFLSECKIDGDPCKILGARGLSVSQNFVYRKRPLVDRWAARVVRQWYLEIGPHSKSLSQFMKARKEPNAKMQNFTAMTWPLAEFVGCGAARMNHGNLVVCFYYPSVDEKNFESSFEIGPTCSRCTIERPTCSKILSSLCGLDIAMDYSSKLCANFSLILAVTMISLNFHYIFNIFLYRLSDLTVAEQLLNILLNGLLN